MNLCAAHSMPYCRICTREVKPPFGSVKKPLAKKQSSRHIKQADYLALIGSAKAAQAGRCAGHVVDPSHECEVGDPFDACHIIPQQALVKELGEGTPALIDPRNVIYACRSIHAQLDAGEIELFRPGGFSEFCSQYRLESNGRYWHRVSVEGAGA